MKSKRAIAIAGWERHSRVYAAARGDPGPACRTIRTARRHFCPFRPGVARREMSRFSGEQRRRWAPWVREDRICRGAAGAIRSGRLFIPTARRDRPPRTQARRSDPRLADPESRARVPYDPNRGRGRRAGIGTPGPAPRRSAPPGGNASSSARSAARRGQSPGIGSTSRRRTKTARRRSHQRDSGGNGLRTASFRARHRLAAARPFGRDLGRERLVLTRRPGSSLSTK